MPRLFEELKRRNVFKVGTAYVVLAWLLAQFTDVFLQPFGTPDWVIKTILLVLVAGFPLALFFAWAFEMTPEGIKKEKDVDRSQSITNETGKKLNLTIIFILVAALAYFAFDKFVLVPKHEAERIQTAENTAEEAATAKPVEKSIAVLPFVNMSDDAANEYFSDGISEEILNALARVKELKVAGRTSSFAFKGQNQDLRQIGEALGVEHILEGSVRKAGTKVRITAQLVQVDDGFHLWSDTYDRELDDVFAIQDEIATAILEQLKAHLLDGEQLVISTPVTHSEAYDRYLLARQRIYERTRPSLEVAADLLDQAIAIDPEYAPAYAQRGITAMLLSEESYGNLAREQSQTQAKLYLDQALRLDPLQPEALAGMGLHYRDIPGKIDESIETLEQALSINPNMVNASNWLQGAYGMAGRLDESELILERMVERDPLYRPGFSNLFGVYMARRELEKARMQIDRIRPFMPNDPFIYSLDGRIHFAEGDMAKGLLLAEKALELQPDDRQFAVRQGLGLWATAQFERLAEIKPRFLRVAGLWRLDRTEEATIVAWELANSGQDVSTLIWLLANSGRQKEAVQFFEERWDSLDAFEKDYPALGSDIGIMVDVAFAYGSLGNEKRFDEAMSHSQATIDTLERQRMKFPYFRLIKAVHFTLAGERKEALDLLAAVVDDGFSLGDRFSSQYAAFKVFDGDPEYEAIQARMFEHMNAQRAELGLEPVNT
jgi:TolB-like protein